MFMSYFIYFHEDYLKKNNEKKKYFCYLFNDKTTGKMNCSDIYQQNIGQTPAEIIHPLQPQPRAGMILPVIHKDTVLLLETYNGSSISSVYLFPDIPYLSILLLFSRFSPFGPFCQSTVIQNPVFQLGLYLSRREILQCPTGLSAAFLCLPFSKSTNPWAKTSLNITNTMTTNTKNKLEHVCTTDQIINVWCSILLQLTWIQ